MGDNILARIAHIVMHIVADFIHANAIDTGAKMILTDKEVTLLIAVLSRDLGLEDGETEPDDAHLQGQESDVFNFSLSKRGGIELPKH